MAVVFDPPWAADVPNLRLEHPSPEDGFDCGGENLREYLNELFFKLTTAANDLSDSTITGQEGVSGGGPLADAPVLRTDWSNLQAIDRENNVPLINGVDLLNIRDISVNDGDGAQRAITVDEFATFILSLIDTTPDFAIDAWADLAVINLQTAPPGTPATGDRYAVAASPTGAWTGQAGKVAYWDGAQWLFFALKPGVLVQYYASSILSTVFSTGAGFAAWAPSTTQAAPVRRATPAEVAARSNVNAFVVPSDLPSPVVSVPSAGTATFDVTALDYLQIYIASNGPALLWTAEGLQGSTWYLLDGDEAMPTGGDLDFFDLFTGGPGYQPWVIRYSQKSRLAVWDLDSKLLRGAANSGGFTKVRITGNSPFRVKPMSMIAS